MCGLARPARGGRAPPWGGRADCGRSRSPSISSREPSPPHSGHAPYGLLNENIRGETSGKEMPHSAQASFSEKVFAAGFVVAGVFVAGFFVAGSVRPARAGGGLLGARPAPA